MSMSDGLKLRVCVCVCVCVCVIEEDGLPYASNIEDVRLEEHRSERRNRSLYDDHVSAVGSCCLQAVAGCQSSFARVCARGSFCLRSKARDPSPDANKPTTLCPFVSLNTHHTTIHYVPLSYTA
jgi:hypothetical protein